MPVNMPSLGKTPVSRVEAYYFNPDGTVELHDLHSIDYAEAVKNHPHEWALVEDRELPTGPDAPKLIDKRNYPVFPSIEETTSQPPYMVTEAPRSVSEKVRQPVKRAR